MRDFENEFDLVTIGNALVDVLADVSDDFIVEQQKSHPDMQRGGMTLINEARAAGLYGEISQNAEVSSGGSAGNTMAGFVSFGGKGAYIGKVADDQLGDSFRKDMESAGVYFGTPSLEDGVATGRCMVLITPDADRTMNTFLGAATELDPDDIDEAVIGNAKVTYMEGYLFDKSDAKQAFYKAARLAKKAGRKVSLTLSDSFCVDRHRDDFLDLVEEHIDILFANEDEIKSLYQTDDFEQALAHISKACEVAAITRSEKGSVILSSDGARHDIAAEPVGKVLDTTGAGDQYAAGFLYGYTQGCDLAECGRLGSAAAAEVISHIGPRPEKQYAQFVKAAA